MLMPEGNALVAPPMTVLDMARIASTVMPASGPDCITSAPMPDLVTPAAEKSTASRRASNCAAKFPADELVGFVALQPKTLDEPPWGRNAAMAAALVNVSFFVPPIWTEPPGYTVENFDARNAPGLFPDGLDPHPPCEYVRYPVVEHGGADGVTVNVPGMTVTM
jgi:hypothetical protein